MLVFVILGLLVCIEAEGDIRKETLFVKTGTDLLLAVGEPVTMNEHAFLTWKFQNKVTIARLTDTNETVLNPGYRGRADFFPQNQSLLLKNVQKTDNGEYKAVGVFGVKTRVLAQYQVIVVDPVSDVKLEVKQCSSDRSDLTVTCTTLDALLSSTFICENTTCSHEGGEPVQNIPPGASMKVYLKDGSVTCHHSNQVSSKEDTKTVEELCRKPDDPVSDVKLEVKQCSSDRSDLTVTCTTLDALLSSTFICENTTCSHEGGEPVQNIPPGASMKVYLKDGSVTCHHSNQVSSKEDTKTIEELCRKPDDPVSDVKLEVKQCSSDRSDLTVTCTTLDALLSSTFICENTTCSHEGGEPVQNIPPGASMKVYLKDGSVTCHHSNQVSSKEDTKTIEELCRKPDVPVSSSAGVSPCMLKIIIVSVGLIIMVSAVISVHVMEKLNKTE